MSQSDIGGKAALDANRRTRVRWSAEPFCVSNHFASELNLEITSNVELPIDAGSASRSAKITSRNCPICDSGSAKEEMRHESWRIVKCSSCELVYMPEIPSESSLEEDFEWDESFARERFERWKKKPLMRLWTALVWTVKPPREMRALRFIRKFAPGGRMLDIGCGDGRLALRAQNSGYEPVGVELSETMAKKAKWRIGDESVFCGRLTDFVAVDGSFDVAVTVSYLEHEPDPAGVMRRSYELLKPGGVCVHKVPNYASKLRTMLGTRWSGYRWPEHFQYYTPPTLGRLLTDAGFEVIATKANPYSDNFWMVGRRA